MGSSPVSKSPREGPPGAAPRLRGGAFVLAMGLVLAACGASVEPGPSDPGGAPASPGRPAIPEDAPVVAFLGDSIAAGLHLSPNESFPAVLERRLAARGLPFRLVNAGVSGDTTSGGLARVDWILRSKPRVVVVELGANDGFRGVPHATIEANLRGIVSRIRDGGARVLLLAVKLPPNLGRDYTDGFDAIFVRVAKDLGVANVPYFMQGVAGVPEQNLADGIHPTPAGHERLAANVEEALAELLR